MSRLPDRPRRHDRSPRAGRRGVVRVAMAALAGVMFVSTVGVPWSSQCGNAVTDDDSIPACCRCPSESKSAGACCCAQPTSRKSLPPCCARRNAVAARPVAKSDRPAVAARRDSDDRSEEGPEFRCPCGPRSVPEVVSNAEPRMTAAGLSITAILETRPLAMARAMHTAGRSDEPATPPPKGMRAARA